MTNSNYLQFHLHTHTCHSKMLPEYANIVSGMKDPCITSAWEAGLRLMHSAMCHTVCSHFSPSSPTHQTSSGLLIYPTDCFADDETAWPHHIPVWLWLRAKTCCCQGVWLGTEQERCRDSLWLKVNVRFTHSDV